MKRTIPVTTLFLDIGGVLLTDGWDQHARERAAAKFKIDLQKITAEMVEELHQLRPFDPEHLPELSCICTTQIESRKSCD